MSIKNKYVIGVDFGTDSVRSVLVDTNSGNEIASSDFLYPRWKQGLYCNPSKNQFRQHPLDYTEGLEYILKDMLGRTDPEIRGNVKAISVCTTGSTPVAVDEKGTPLALHKEFEDNPNAMFFLWKDHTAVKEAEEINKYSKKLSTNYLEYVGGDYSSEWFWAKLLYVLREDSQVKDSCFTWLEHSDWIPHLLIGAKDLSHIKRNICAAGHKALWAEDFGGFPSEDFFSGLDPMLSEFRKSLSEKVYSSAESAGTLSIEWAKKIGLNSEVLVGVGALDAHMGAVGGQIEPFYLSKVMGTSTCDMVIAPSKDLQAHTIKGICGQVRSSIIPGMIGMEAGQSAFGDIYSWFRDVISWPLKNLHTELVNTDTALNKKKLEEFEGIILTRLVEAASKLPLEKDGELAVDWLNGRRTPETNQLLKGAIHGLSLGTNAPRIFRSLVEATCFGSKRIVEHFIEEGIPIKGIIGVGGVAKKAPFIMQMMADVLGMPIKIHKSEQTSAIGAAMFAATVGGEFIRVEDAMSQMGQGFEREFYPDRDRNSIYEMRYRKYKALCRFVDEKYS